MTYQKNHMGANIHIKDMHGAIVKRLKNGDLFIDFKYMDENPLDITMTISPHAFDQLFQKAREIK